MHISKYILYISKKILAKLPNMRYTTNCCGMIAMKREVAAVLAGFPRSECQVMKLATSHCTEYEIYAEQVENDVKM